MAQWGRGEFVLLVTRLELQQTVVSVRRRAPQSQASRQVRTALQTMEVALARAGASFAGARERFAASPPRPPRPQQAPIWKASAGRPPAATVWQYRWWP